MYFEIYDKSNKYCRNDLIICKFFHFFYLHMLQNNSYEFAILPVSCFEKFYAIYHSSL